MLLTNLMRSLSSGDYVNVMRQIMCLIALWPLVRWFWKDEIKAVKKLIATKLSTKKEAA